MFPPDIASFSRMEQLQLVWLGGVAMSGCMFACTQGLMLLSTCAIAAYYNDTPPKHGAWCHYVMICFAAFILVGAVGQFCFGVLIRQHVGPEALHPPLVVFSNVVVYPNIALVTGLLLINFFFLLCGTIFSVSFSENFSVFLPIINVSAVFLLAWFLSAYVMTNIGLAGSVFAGASAIVTMLSTVMVLAPVFVFNELHRMIRNGRKRGSAGEVGASLVSPRGQDEES
jgi:hypothetical protein